MENPIFGGGKTKLDKRTIEAAEKALASPCAICGATANIQARQLVPHFPQLFGCPEGFALFVPLCPDHEAVDKAPLEAHLAACREMSIREAFGPDDADLQEE